MINVGNAKQQKLAEQIKSGINEILQEIKMLNKKLSSSNFDESDSDADVELKETESKS